MEIDIISFTDSQYASLTAEQLMEVKEVQQKKNRLLRTLDEKKAALKFRLLEQGIYGGSSYQKACEEMDDVYEQEIEWLRDGLLFYLRFSMREEGDSSEGESPYEADYSLSYADRIAVVRNYYESMYTDPIERLNAYREDKVALVYLGEYYQGLYDLYYVDAYGQEFT